MEPAPSAAPMGPESAAADTRPLGRIALLLAAAGVGVLVFLLSLLVFGRGGWGAFRFALMLSSMFACIDSRGNGSWQGWVRGTVAVFIVAVLWSLLGLPRE